MSNIIWAIVLTVSNIVGTWITWRHRNDSSTVSDLILIIIGWSVLAFEGGRLFGIKFGTFEGDT